jgi:pyridoxine/pyridoxamine 5'-phosphate oxidase
MANLADLRKDYSLAGLSEKDLAPDSVEFWQGRRRRLHDRLRCRRDPGGERIVERLSP